MDVPFLDGVTWEPQRRHNSLLDQVVKYLWASNCFTGSSLGGFDLSWGMVCITHISHNTLTGIANFWPTRLKRMESKTARKCSYCSEPILCPRLCGTLSSSYSLLDPFCYDYQLTWYMTVSIYIDVNMQYTQSNTSTQTVNISSLRRSADGPPTFRRRSADLPHWWPRLLSRTFWSAGTASPTSAANLAFTYLF